MKRLTLILILFALAVAFVVLPIASVDAKNASPLAKTIGTSNVYPVAERTEISLAESPVWAQVLIVFVVGVFGLLAVVPLLLKGSEWGG